MAWVLIFGSACWIGCSEEAARPTTSAKAGSPARASTPPAKPPAPPVELTPEEQIEAGRVAYNANCIACHSLDPTKDGALGPAVAGSSLELLEARILRAEYPEGYTPKRDTKVMVALPHLKPKLQVLAAYLDSLE